MKMTDGHSAEFNELAERALHLQDLLTIPTVVTIGGLALVLDGCREIDTIGGVTKVAIGRGADLVDGFLARRLNQTSDAGALADVFADKVGMSAILAAAWHKDAVPKPVLATIAAKHATNATLTTLAGIRHPHASYRPTKTGKLGMFADNAALFGYLYGHAYENERPDLGIHPYCYELGRAGFAAGVSMGIVTAAEYFERI